MKQSQKHYSDFMHREIDNLRIRNTRGDRIMALLIQSKLKENEHMNKV